MTVINLPVTMSPAGCLTRGLLCCLKLPSSWITANFSTCASTASLQTYRAKIFKTKNKKAERKPSLFSHCNCTLHCSELHKWPISTDSDETVLVSNFGLSKWERLTKNEEKCLSCLSLYNVKHWSHVNKNKLR